MKRIATYLFTTDAAPKLLSVLGERFSRYRGKGGGFTFIAGSDEELRFRELIVQNNLPTVRREFPSVSRKEIASVPFFYLSIRYDREYPRPEYMDTSKRCGGDESTFCDVGVKQAYKVMVIPSRSKNFDIMFDDMWLKPRIIIITKKLKELLVSVKASGCIFVPCLRPDSDYSEKERSFDSFSAKPDDDATHFQLVITGRPLRAPSVGTLNRIVQQCTRCGTAYRWDSSDELHFEPGDLPPVDFAVYDRIRAEGGSEYEFAVQVCMVSSRILQLFLKEKIKGLRPYMPDPDLKYGVVDIR